MGFPAKLFGLCCHGYVLIPSSPCQPGRDGVQVPVEPPGAGGQWLAALQVTQNLKELTNLIQVCPPPPGASEDPALPVGLSDGRVPGAAGETSPVRRWLWFCTRLPALQPGGVSVAGLGHLPDDHLHWHAALDTGLTGSAADSSPVWAGFTGFFCPPSALCC